MNHTTPHPSTPRLGTFLTLLIAMVLFALPGGQPPALAQGTSGANPGTPAATASTAAELQAAIDAVPAGGSATITVAEGTALESPITVSERRAITLDGSTTVNVSTAISNAASDGGAITVDEGASLTLAGPTFDGGKAAHGNVKALLSVRGALTMTAGALRDFHGWGSDGGTVTLRGGGSFALRGGTISGNTGVFPGVAMLSLQNDAAQPTMTLSGGAIEDNTGLMGAGIFLRGGTLTMTGGSISRNSATYQGGYEGGGIATWDLYDSELTITGGIFEGNLAPRGGAIYVGEQTTLRMQNVLITGNTATSLGGGIWNCSNSQGEQLVVTRGAALFGNRAQGKDGAAAAGDEITLMQLSSGSSTLANRMLGGGATTYYRDGAMLHPESIANVAPDPSAARFDAANPGDPVTITKNTDPYALKERSATGAQKLAASLATVKITGNTASQGGGIANNGKLVIGDTDAKETSVRVVKEWDGSIEESSRKAVTVQLKLGDHVIDEAVLDADSNWEHTFTGLPLPENVGDGTLRYSVVEAQAAENGYAPSYSALEQQADGTYAVRITNKLPVAPHASIALTAHKTLEGRDLKKGEFAFEVKNESGAVVARASNAADGTVSFPELSYTAVGSQVYTVSEVAGHAEGITYDTRVYTVRVTVSAQTDGSLAATSAIDGTDGGADAITFKNVYEQPKKPSTPETPKTPEKPGTSGSTDTALPHTGDTVDPGALLSIAAIGAVLVGCGVHRARQLRR